mmetsp:Transcript_106332/g.305713  ORF Transcript_106332/g.305713 Transcript_106332/m.305713 type:complete len:157 (-) Transcript_106332:865-1335(-)
MAALGRIVAMEAKKIDRKILIADMRRTEAIKPLVNQLLPWWKHFDQMAPGRSGAASWLDSVPPSLDSQAAHLQRSADPVQGGVARPVQHAQQELPHSPKVRSFGPGRSLGQGGAATMRRMVCSLRPLSPDILGDVGGPLCLAHGQSLLARAAMYVD